MHHSKENDAKSAVPQEPVSNQLTFLSRNMLALPDDAHRMARYPSNTHYPLDVYTDHLGPLVERTQRKANEGEGHNCRLQYRASEARAAAECRLCNRQTG